MRKGEGGKWGASMLGEVPTVLVVDDDAGVRAVLRIALNRIGYAVDAAASGPAALELFRAAPSRYAVVLVDVCMPGMDGPATVAALRTIQPLFACAFITGDSGRHSLRELEAIGDRPALMKPFDATAIRDLVRDLAGERASA